MAERLRENYFLIVRICLLLALEIYIVISKSILTEASGRVLLLLALFVGVISGKELIRDKKKKLALILVAAVLCGIMIYYLGNEFILLAVFVCYEALSLYHPSLVWYCVPFFATYVSSDIGVYVQLLFTLLIGIIYVQHDFVIRSYKEQTREDTISEQHWLCII